MTDVALHPGDCLAIMPTMDANSVDSIVTDPPYGLSFMGKDWDHGVPGEHFWREALRVAKPGAHLLAFGGTRTFHRLAVAIEDAGWEIRDTVCWLYGSGFPKSLNIGKRLLEWAGWGTALKPAWEPIIVARKPLEGTVAANVLEWGTGAVNVDGCRIGVADGHGGGRHGSSGFVNGYQHDGFVTSHAGRWPANVVHDGSDEVLAGFPVTTSGKMRAGQQRQASRNGGGYHGNFPGLHLQVITTDTYGDTGSAARFFYCAKASKADRDEGLDGVEPRQQDESRKNGNPGGDNPRNRGVHLRTNHHPTVKPTDLMRWLVRLVTPPGGIVLDPFMGSGSTGKAAVLEGFRFIGIDTEAEYVEIARRRIDAARLPLFAAQEPVDVNA